MKPLLYVVENFQEAGVLPTGVAMLPWINRAVFDPDNMGAFDETSYRSRLREIAKGAEAGALCMIDAEGDYDVDYLRRLLRIARGYVLTPGLYDPCFYQLYGKGLAWLDRAERELQPLWLFKESVIFPSCYRHIAEDASESLQDVQIQGYTDAIGLAQRVRGYRRQRVIPFVYRRIDEHGERMSKSVLQADLLLMLLTLDGAPYSEQMVLWSEEAYLRTQGYTTLTDEELRLNQLQDIQQVLEVLQRPDVD